MAARLPVLPPGDSAALKQAVSAQANALLVLGTECSPLALDELEDPLGETGRPGLAVRT